MTMEQEITWIRKAKEPVLKINRSKDMVYLTFPEMEKTGRVKHLFTTRAGGVSTGHLASMNVSYSRGDEPANVDENYRRIAAVMKRELEDFVCSDQTHTANVRKVTEADRGKGILYPKDYQDVDGLITNVAGIVLTTFYADCVPLFFVDAVQGAIGLSHSGWRGTVAGIGAVTVRRMQQEYGSRPEHIIAAIGPSICQTCYEVSWDVAEAFQKRFGKENEQKILQPKANDKYLLDLWKANELVLLEAGIRPEHISVTDLCTCCNPDHLFSHRASHGKRGNMGAFLSLEK